jgi:hypothetical protein
MFIKKILAEFPTANDLAFQRIFKGLRFFDTKTHKALYAKDLIKAALYLAYRVAHRSGLTLYLSKDEEKLMRSLFKFLPWFCAGLLLFNDLFDYWQ